MHDENKMKILNSFTICMCDVWLGDTLAVANQVKNWFVCFDVYSVTIYLKQLDETVGEEKTDTDKNMATMFDILRRTKRVQLENLILNRTSFAQTVENLFALSFLVKDGRAMISLDENRSHYVCKMCFHHNYPKFCFLFLFCTIYTLIYAILLFST